MLNEHWFTQIKRELNFFFFLFENVSLEETLENIKQLSKSSLYFYFSIFELVKIHFQEIILIILLDIL